MVKKNFMVLMIALMCGLAAFVLIFNYLKQVSNPAKSFVVSQKKIEAGKKIEKKDIGYSAPLKNISPKEYFLQADDVINLIATEEIPANKLLKRSWVKREEIAPENEGAEDPKKMEIPQGKTGVLMYAKDMNNLPPNLQVGSRIDLLANRKPVSGGAIKTTKSAQAATIIEITKNDKGVPESFLLAVTPQESEKIFSAMASGGGKFRVALSSGVASLEAIVPDLSSVEIIRGLKVEKKNFQTGEEE